MFLARRSSCPASPGPPVRCRPSAALTWPSPAGRRWRCSDPNGAGKSTKIDMVLGLARPDAGSVTLSGKSPCRRGGRGHRRRHAADRVAAAGPDRPGARDDDRLAGIPRPLPVDEALALTRTAELADRPGGRLSGGQAQRVRFASVKANGGASLQLTVLGPSVTRLDKRGRMPRTGEPGGLGRPPRQRAPADAVRAMTRFHAAGSPGARTYGGQA
jgi:hypothetical protein